MCIRDRANWFKHQDEVHGLSDLNVSVEGGVVIINIVGIFVLDMTAHEAGEATFEILSGVEGFK